jgi:recombination protein RecR
MQFFPAPVENLIDHFARLPGIGRKTAQRLAFHVLSLPEEEAQSFAEALVRAKKEIKFCRNCQNLAVEDLCSICSAKGRDTSTICVVSGPKDVAAIERTYEYRGLYHVLHGVISPMNHVSPDDIRIKELLARVNTETIKEVIMATNPDTEGEATALYISRLLNPFDIKVTRLAYGIPMGSHLEFTDEVTLGRALEGRREI